MVTWVGIGVVIWCGASGAIAKKKASINLTVSRCHVLGPSPGCVIATSVARAAFG